MQVMHDEQRYILFQDDIEQQSLLFNAPERLIIVDQPQEFEAGLAALELARSQGKWLAGYFSYEAGYLLEPKLAPLLPEGRRSPLICFGVFDRTGFNPAVFINLEEQFRRARENKGPLLRCRQMDIGTIMHGLLHG